ncbi:MAG: hypothetical protein PUP92_37705 [Rhizonema sp. PD38]|nr:hypothetical protein [Rhizonema sp. PD38]
MVLGHPQPPVALAVVGSVTGEVMSPVDGDVIEFRCGRWTGCHSGEDVIAPLFTQEIEAASCTHITCQLYL